MEGYIKLPRSLLEWEWFDDPNTLSVYLRLLFLAEYKPKQYKGYEVNRGQHLTTTAKLSAQCGLSAQQTRTALFRLVATNKITIKSTNKFSIITLIEYDCNFENNKQDNKPITNEQHDLQQTNNKPTLLFIKKAKNKESQEYARAREAVGLENIDESFAQFWNAYPKKTAKQNAFKAWKNLNPDKELTEKILSSLERHKISDQWTKDDGQYIPYPATWLNGRRWEDDVQFPLESTNTSSFNVNDVMKQIMQRYANNLCEKNEAKK